MENQLSTAEWGSWNTDETHLYLKANTEHILVTLLQIIYTYRINKNLAHCRWQGVRIARKASFSRNKQNWSTFTEILLFIRNEMLTIRYMNEWMKIPNNERYFF